LGRAINRFHRRFAEQEKFLNWLIEVIKAEDIEILLVAGDIFDSQNPPLQAQELYYAFLVNCRDTNLKQVVITAGNHDSAGFLTAPSGLLRALNIHVVGDPASDPSSDLLTLKDSNGQPILLVAAVPYLKDRYLRTSKEGETVSERDFNFAQGLARHYATLAELAQKRQAALGGAIPAVAMGHLFARGGEVTEGDGVRDLYVGTMALFDPQTFPQVFDYIALGHLHRPQKAKLETIRYSGSPLKMSFQENANKSVTMVTLGDNRLEISLKPVPIFQELLRLKGDRNQILKELFALKQAGSNAYLEIVHTGSELIGARRLEFEEAIKGTNLALTAVIEASPAAPTYNKLFEARDLAEMTHLEVFEKLLDQRKIPEEARIELKETYEEILQALAGEDLPPAVSEG
jgi:exonuclease SbcD